MCDAGAAFGAESQAKKVRRGLDGPTKEELEKEEAKQEALVVAAQKKMQADAIDPRLVKFRYSSQKICVNNCIGVQTMAINPVLRAGGSCRMTACWQHKYHCRHFVDPPMYPISCTRQVENAIGGLFLQATVSFNCACHILSVFGSPGSQRHVPPYLVVSTLVAKASCNSS